ncbi:unnamed protein product, partial [Owenia fusiformis]
ISSTNTSGTNTLRTDISSTNTSSTNTLRTDVSSKRTLRKDTLKTVTYPRNIIFGPHPEYFEDIRVKEHFEHLLNSHEKNIINIRVYKGLDYQNICVTHSEELIFSQIKHMYDLAGIKIGQHLNNEVMENLLQQLGPRLYNSSDYEYSVEWTQDHFHQNVHMKISETFLGKQTYGGSSFRIHVQGVHSFLCNVKDNFNRTYYVCCPYVPPCSNITITLMYMNYRAFLDNIPNVKPFSLILARIHNCDLHSRDQKSHEQFEKNMIEKVHCNRDPKFISKYGRWISKEGIQRWGLHSECLTKALKAKELKNCFKKLKKIDAYGDSHLRYTMAYFGSFFKNDFKVQDGGKWGFDHFNFNWCPGSPAVWKSLSKDFNLTVQNTKPLRSKPKDKQNGVILINNGSWDFMQGSFSEYLHNIQSLLVPLIRKYRQNSAWNTTRIIWLSNIAFPHEYRFIFDHGGHHKRNDFRAAGANALIESLILDLGVDFINQLVPTSIRSSDNVCSAHYICQRDVSGPEKARGDVGIAVANMLFDDMCT